MSRASRMRLVWSVLRKSSIMVDGLPIVDGPLDLLKLSMPSSAASNALSLLEERGYICKQMPGSKASGRIVILNDAELLGDDVLVPHKNDAKKQGVREETKQTTVQGTQLGESRQNFLSTQWRGSPIRVFDLDVRSEAAELRGLLGDKLYAKFVPKQEHEESIASADASPPKPSVDTPDVITTALMAPMLLAPPPTPPPIEFKEVNSDSGVAPDSGVASPRSLAAEDLLASSTAKDLVAALAETLVQEGGIGALFDVLLSKRKGVAVYIDYENIAIPLLSAGSAFPAEEILSFARKKGNVLDVFVFVPLHIATQTPQVIEHLRRDGFQTAICPSIKDGKGDTVDKTLEHFIMRDLPNPEIHTFILVSHDADFDDARRAAQNYGKRCITIFLDESIGELRSSDGGIIPLRVKPRITTSGAHIKENVFASIMRGLCGSTIKFDSNDVHHVFIKAILGLLKVKEVELRNIEFRNTFRSLGDLLWAGLRSDFRYSFGKNNLNDVMHALQGLNILVYRRGTNAQGENVTHLVYDNASATAKTLIRVMNME